MCMNPRTLPAAAEMLVPMELQPLILQAGQLHGAWSGDLLCKALRFELQWLGDQFHRRLLKIVLPVLVVRSSRLPVSRGLASPSAPISRTRAGSARFAFMPHPKGKTPRQTPTPAGKLGQLSTRTKSQPEWPLI